MVMDFREVKAYHKSLSYYRQAQVVKTIDFFSSEGLEVSGAFLDL